MMMKGGNSNQVIDKIKTRVEEIQQTLPEGVKIEAFLDRTKWWIMLLEQFLKPDRGALIVVLYWFCF